MSKGGELKALTWILDLSIIIKTLFFSYSVYNLQLNPLRAIIVQ